MFVGGRASQARPARPLVGRAGWRDAADAVRVVLRRSQRQRERRRLQPAFARTPNGQTSAGRRPAPRPPRRPSRDEPSRVASTAVDCGAASARRSESATVRVVAAASLRRDQAGERCLDACGVLRASSVSGKPPLPRARFSRARGRPCSARTRASGGAGVLAALVGPFGVQANARCAGVRADAASAARTPAPPFGRPRQSRPYGRALRCPPPSVSATMRFDAIPSHCSSLPFGQRTSTRTAPA